MNEPGPWSVTVTSPSGQDWHYAGFADNITDALDSAMMWREDELTPPQDPS